MNMRIVVGVCLILAGCAAAPRHETIAGRAIVPSARAIGVIGHSEEWLPEESQVARLEKEIGRLFDHPDRRMSGVLTRDGLPPRKAPYPITDYFVRYCGIIKEGKKLIVGKASHRSISDPGRALSIPDRETVELSPFGGGTFFFTVTFDPATTAISDLSYNAPL
jgi:hypothetical protein